MRGRSHIFWAMMLNSRLNPEDVWKVNRAIDTPSPMDMVFNNANRRNNFIVPGMNMNGHRQFNHDLLSAMMKGNQVGGIKGAEAALYHLMGDVVSDNLVKGFGSTDIRDMFESAWLHANKVPKYNFKE